MILSQKILQLRKKQGWSQEELAEKLGVSRQSVSKWEGAVSLPEIDKIMELAAVFGVTTDYLLRDDMETAEYADGSDRRYPALSIEQADAFLDVRQRYARWMAAGVALCVVSPVPLLLLACGAEYFGLLSENLAGGLGVVILLALVAAAVAVFIVISGWLQPWLKVRRGEFELSYGVSGILQSRLEICRRRTAAMTAAGVALCILCAVPLLLAAGLEAPEYMLLLAVCLLLTLVAGASAIFILADGPVESLQMLLQQGYFAPERREDRRRERKLDAVYWPVVTALYLGVSFYTRAWHMSWIVWPVAGVLYGALRALVRRHPDEEEF